MKDDIDLLWVAALAVVGWVLWTRFGGRLTGGIPSHLPPPPPPPRAADQPGGDSTATKILKAGGKKACVAGAEAYGYPPEACDYTGAVVDKVEEAGQWAWDQVSGGGSWGFFGAAVDRVK